VPDFPLTKVSWILEHIEKNRTKVVIVHSGFVDENFMNSYNTRWVWIAERLDVFAVSKKPEKTQKQITSALMLIPICLAFLAIITIFKNSDEFVTGFFWISLLIVTSLALIPFVEKYKKFSWRDHPIIALIGITCVAQVIVTVYWGLAFDAGTTTPLTEQLAIDMTSFYFLMISLIPIGLGVSYMAIKFSQKPVIGLGILHHFFACTPHCVFPVHRYEARILTQTRLPIGSHLLQLLLAVLFFAPSVLPTSRHMLLSAQNSHSSILFFVRGALSCNQLLTASTHTLLRSQQFLQVTACQSTAGILLRVCRLFFAGRLFD